MTLFDGYTVTVEDRTEKYGEHRLRTLGRLSSQVIVICHGNR